MKKLVHRETHAGLATTSTPVLLSLLIGCGALGLLGIVLGAQLSDYWKASTALGWHAFHSLLWWEASATLLCFGVPGYFCLLAAQRCADTLLDRFGFK